MKVWLLLIYISVQASTVLSVDYDLPSTELQIGTLNQTSNSSLAFTSQPPSETFEVSNDSLDFLLEKDNVLLFDDFQVGSSSPFAIETHSGSGYDSDFENFVSEETESILLKNENTTQIATAVYDSIAMLDSLKVTCTSGFLCRFKLLFTEHKSTLYILIGISMAAIILFFIFVFTIEKVTRRKKKISKGFGFHLNPVSELNLIKRESQLSQNEHPIRTTMNDEGYF